MMELFRYIPGAGPLLVNFPHSGTFVPEIIAGRMTKEGLAAPDADIYLERLYVFLRTLKIPHLYATHSRYVVDLNRPPDDSRLYRGTFGTGLFPDMTFRGQAIYKKDEEFKETERKARMDVYYRPYHNRLKEELEKIKEKFGYYLLWDAHSIKSEVPSLFEGRLPDYNFGTNNKAACNLNMERPFKSLLYHLGEGNVVFDQRFIGGYITRHYGKSKEKRYALQLELSQKTYMDELTGEYSPEKSVLTMALLHQLITTYQKTIIM